MGDDERTLDVYLISSETWILVMKLVCVCRPYCIENWDDEKKKEKQQQHHEMKRISFLHFMDQPDEHRFCHPKVFVLLHWPRRCWGMRKIAKSVMMRYRCILQFGRRRRQ